MPKGPKRLPKQHAKIGAQKRKGVSKRPAPGLHLPIECHEKIMCEGTMVPWTPGTEVNIGVCDGCFSALWEAFWWQMGCETLEEMPSAPRPNRN
jgi:hypothetical protein